jgi:hypothetical protein
MTVSTLAFRGSSWSVALNNGQSDEAAVISEQARETEGVSPSVTMDRQAMALELLTSALSEAQADNWDAYGARAPHVRAVYEAIRFIKCLPTSVPSPEVAIDADGDVALEWDRGPRFIFSVRVDKDGKLHYAGLFGHATKHGSEFFGEGIPREVLTGIERLVRATWDGSGAR